MKKVICCENGNHDNLLVCKNCNVENFHYYSNWPNENKNILICSFCKIETTRELEAKQIKLLY